MIIRTTVISLLLAATAWSQARVGTNPIMNLHGFPASVRSAGMGMVGVALTECEAGLHNPALLCLGCGNYVSFTTSPVSSEVFGQELIHYRFDHFSVRVPVTETSPFTIGFGYGHTDLTLGPFHEITYDRGIDLTAEGDLYFTDDASTWSLAVAWAGPVDLSVGASLIRMKSQDPLRRISGRAGAFGFAVRAPLNRILSRSEAASAKSLQGEIIFGVSFQDYGSDIDFNYGVYRWPKSGRYGLGVDLAYGDRHHAWVQLRPVVERRIRYSGDEGSEWRYGLELGLAELLALRLGLVDGARVKEDVWYLGDDRYYEHQTRGLGISTVGLRKLLTDRPPSGSANTGIWRYLVDNLNIEFSFARMEMYDDRADPTDYYAIRLTM